MIPSPLQPRVIREAEHTGVFEIDALYPGYGQTIGNSIRRVLLSSLHGAAITSVKIAGVGHEFSTIAGVMEDIVTIILNLKQLRFHLYEEGPWHITVAVRGEQKVTGADFEIPSQLKLINTGAHVATLTSKKSAFEMEAVVESGLGYVPVEAQMKEKVEVGTIALDASFSPVRHVNYEIENMRVGDRTDYNRLRFHIETDGSITAREAFQQACGILVEQFTALAEGFTVSSVGTIEGESHSSRNNEGLFSKAPRRESDQGFTEHHHITMKIGIDELKISSRVLNTLREVGIKTVGGLARKREETLREIEGIGDKGMQEIKKALGNFGITLKQ